MLPHSNGQWDELKDGNSRGRGDEDERPFELFHRLSQYDLTQRHNQNGDGQQLHDNIAEGPISRRAAED